MPNTAADNCVINPTAISERHTRVVAAIIWHRMQVRRFLIAQRQSGKHLAGYWEFPGGKVEAGESAQAALRRELIEEIEIEPVRVNPFMQVYFRYPEKNILLDTWIVEDYRGEVNSGERQALAWIGVEQIENYLFPPADLPILEALSRLERAARE